MLFDEVKTRTKQGDIGEARAIYEYTRLGYTVCAPLTDSDKYDLIIDDGISLKKVQVKTSRHKISSTGYEVNIATKGGNTKEHSVRHRRESDYDILFILTEQDDAWSIPVGELYGARSSVTVGNKKYNEFKL